MHGKDKEELLLLDSIKEWLGRCQPFKLGNLDTGILHSSANESRQKFSLEFWYFLPEDIDQEIVLTRRSICFPREPVESLCRISEQDRLLWELVVFREIIIRTIRVSFESPMTVDED